MKANEFLTVAPCRNMFLKLTGDYRASITGTRIEAVAKSREAAILALHQKLFAFGENQHFRKYYRTNGGEVLCLYHDLSGYGYDIFTPGQANPTSCFMGTDCTKEKAIAAVENHVRQYNEDHERRKI